MKTNFEKVIEFNKCFSHKVSEIQYLDIFTEEPKLVDLRLKLIKEEIEELNDAFKVYDIVEIIDALSDILYVVYGMCATFGIDIDKHYREYITKSLSHDEREKTENNLTNFQLTKLLFTQTNTFILKDFVDNCKDRDYFNLLKNNLNDINKNYENIEDACNNNDFHTITSYLILIVEDTYTFGLSINVNLDDSFAIVHDSNMTKICDNEELAKETVVWYESNDTKYDSPIYKHTEFGYIILNESTGKILKSIKYTPANFSSLLN
jgi:predicted HAD superfamily Cof-like phosphohydrolase